MKTYEITFTGLRAGEKHEIRYQAFAESAEAATDQILKRFHLIGFASTAAREVPSPFAFEDIVNRVQNTQEEHRLIRLWTEKLRDTINEVAKRQARANADWHDDEDSPEHLLYHAPSIEQFPRELRDAAILELVSLHLEVINENERALAEKVGAL